MGEAKRRRSAPATRLALNPANGEMVSRRRAGDPETFVAKMESET
jgi:hypothetical protein